MVRSAILTNQLGDLPAFGRSRDRRGKGAMDLDSALGSLLGKEGAIGGGSGGKSRASSRGSRQVC